MIEPVMLRIESDPHTLRFEADSLVRIARVHEALRDLGLELCSQCHVWKGPDRMGWIGVDLTAEAGGGSFTSAICTTCVPLPSPLEGEGCSPTASGVRVSPAPDAATSLRHAIAQVAQPDGPETRLWREPAPCSAWAR